MVVGDVAGHGPVSGEFEQGEAEFAAARQGLDATADGPKGADRLRLRPGWRRGWHGRGTEHAVVGGGLERDRVVVVSDVGQVADKAEQGPAAVGFAASNSSGGVEELVDEDRDEWRRLVVEGDGASGGRAIRRARV